MQVYHYTQIQNIRGILQSGQLIPQDNPHFPQGDLGRFNLPAGFGRSGISALLSPQPEEWMRDDGPFRHMLDVLSFKTGVDLVLLEIETDGLDAYVLDAGYLGIYRAMHKYYGTDINKFVNPKYLIPEQDLEAGEKAILAGQNERFLKSIKPIGEYTQEVDNYQVPEVFISSVQPIPIEGRVRISREQPMLERYLEKIQDGRQRQSILDELQSLAIAGGEDTRGGFTEWYQGYVMRENQSHIQREIGY